MLAFASPIVVWSAMLKIVIASLAGGAGVAIVFGFVIYGLERAEQDGAGSGTKVLNWSIVAVAGAFCLFAVAVGVWAMTQKS